MASASGDATNATAGCRAVEVTDERKGTTFPMLVFYPSADREEPARFGPYTADVALNGGVREGRFPLVVVSHGSGGSHLLYRGLAAHLARAGFVVACPEHPGNNRNDNSLAETLEILVERPRHVRLAIDHVASDGMLGPRVEPDAVAVVGHSLGGYTGLALAGGTPAAVTRDGPVLPPQLIPVTPDYRVKALVLLAPATPWFVLDGALAEVRVPILMLTAERDAQTTPWHADVVKRGLPETTELVHETVAGAGHYSFLAPFPVAMTNAGFPPSQDPPGFDRAAFHVRMHAAVEAFLRRVL